MLLPVEVTADVPMARQPSCSLPVSVRAPDRQSGIIEVELDGGVEVRIRDRLYRELAIRNRRISR